ncbi:Allergen [Penicillium macrosclerotiorum]|uniref:Allergen n=1 Tax=Penicillium macrosclerotiorum TaxID=303699 RepID=UPI002548961C|nr:Allergen [Penicillium macrosclerotiorum]KAJ5693136.1 Allergen [Penicillium macrosclerotiorum]
MHFHSLLLATALTAGSAAARLHGHERRHAHGHAVEIEAEPEVTPAVELKDRAVGDVVSAYIDGVLETWINEWSGEVAAATSTSSTLVQVTTTATPTQVTTSNPVESTVVPTPASSSGGAWSNMPSDGQFSRSGFGGVSASKTTGLLDWDYVGNVGVPWGSNIIQVEEGSASQYKHVLRFEGSNTDPWTVLFWNTYGPEGKMDGFWAPNKALSFTLEPNEVVYVAIDDNSQGGWAAAKGETIPTTGFGQYAATWGEFDMSSEKNDGFSGWDVSCIIAQLNDLEIQGMRICNHLGNDCSAIGAGLTGLLNAYTSADQGKPDKAVSQSAGAVRLVVQLDYA